MPVLFTTEHTKNIKMGMALFAAIEVIYPSYAINHLYFGIKKTRDNDLGSHYNNRITQNK